MVFSIPYLAPNITLYLFLMRCICNMATVSVTNSPLIVDYVSSTTRGQAGTIVNFGQKIGELFVFLVIVSIGSSYSFSVSFKIGGSIIMISAFIHLFLIKEPKSF